MHGLLEGGVAIAPGAYEVMFPSLAHTDADLERTVTVFGEVACRLAAGTPR
jgi:glutamate-1-semialdehyde 2,1-aminomutase